MFIYLTFVAFCLLSVIRKQWLEQYNRRPISAYDRIPERFLRHQSLWSSVWNFCRRVADVPPRETSLTGDERGETSVFTGYWTSFKTPFRANFTETNGLNKIVDSRDKIVLIDGETLEDSLRETEKLALLDTLAQVLTERESKLTYMWCIFIIILKNTKLHIS